MGIEAEEDENFWSPKQFLLKGLCTDLLGLTPSELQQWGSSLKVTRHIQEGNELSSIMMRFVGVTYSQTEVIPEPIFPLLSLRPQSQQQALYWRVYQPGSHCLSHPGDSLRSCLTQLSGLPNCFQWLPYEWLALIHASDFPKLS